MEILPLTYQLKEENRRLAQKLERYEKILKETQKHVLNEAVVAYINKEVAYINAHKGPDRFLTRKLWKSQSRILRRLEKDVKIVAKNHYRNMWLALGMAAFGIPFGVAIGSALGSMAYLSIGLPIGMAIGIAIGTNLDQKAAKEGRQIDVEL